MANRLIIILIFLLVLFPKSLFASEAFDYISDVIQSLTICKIGNELVQRNADNKNTLSLLKDLNVWQIKLRQAMRRVEPYIESENELIQKSATSIYLVYVSILESSESELKLFEEMLAGAYGETPNRPLSVITQEFAETQAKNEGFWRQLVPATIVASYTLIELDKGDSEEIRSMTITKKERESLKSDLLLGFGDEIRGGLKAGQYPLVVSAASLWKVLNDGWKSADEK